MAVNSNVFASNSERRNFYKLRRAWGEKYAIYHNLPFLNVFATNNLFDFTGGWKNVRPIELADVDRNRLKKTSIDYTLCDDQDKPLVCIEFDGLQQGFNVGATYYANTERPDIWRRQITELKLRVAHGSLFPFVVVGSGQFEDITPDVKHTIVDGIIGSVLAYRTMQTRLGAGFDPTEMGYSQGEFDALPPDLQQEVVQNWLLGLEVETEMENNPVARASGRLQAELGALSYGVEYLSYPTLDTAKNFTERVRMFNNVINHGSKITLKTEAYGDISATAWIPNYQAIGVSSMSLSENIAMLLALSKLKRRRQAASTRKPR